MRAVPRRGRAAGVRMDLTEMQARELDQTLWRDLEAFVEEECESELAARAAPLRGRVRQRARGAGAAARARARRRADALREDRPDRRRPVRRARRSSRTTSPASSAHSAARDRERAAPADPALHARPARPRRARAARRPLPAARRQRASARGLVRATEAETLPGYVSQRLPRRGGVLGRRRVGARAPRRRSPSGSGRATSATTRAAASARRGATSGPICRIERA